MYEWTSHFVCHHLAFLGAQWHYCCLFVHIVKFYWMIDKIQEWMQHLWITGRDNYRTIICFAYLVYLYPLRNFVELVLLCDGMYLQYIKKIQILIIET